MTGPTTPPPGSPAPRVGWTRTAATLAVLAMFEAGMLVTLLFTWLTPIGRPPQPGRPPARTPVRVAQAKAPEPPAVAPVAAPVPAAPPEPPAPTPAPPPAPTPAPVRRPPSRPHPAAPAAAPAPSPTRLVEVQILSTPPGATVKVSGVTYGVTPLSAFLPDDRRAVLTLELAGHAPARLTWVPGGPTTLASTLIHEDHP